VWLYFKFTLSLRDLEKVLGTDQRYLISRSTLRTFRAAAMEGWYTASAAAA
jgi:hypothetical protein